MPAPQSPTAEEAAGAHTMELSSLPRADSMQLPLSLVPLHSLDTLAAWGVTGLADKFPGASKRVYYCQRCLNHGRLEPRKNHKCECAFAHCNCEKCILVEKRRVLNTQLHELEEITEGEPAEAEEAENGAARMKGERVPNCQKCGQHGRKSRLKGHKRVCPFRDCNCPKCQVVSERQKLMADQIKIRRRQRKDTIMNLTRESMNAALNAASALAAAGAGAPPSSMNFNFGGINAFLYSQLKTPSTPVSSVSSLTTPATPVSAASAAAAVPQVPQLAPSPHSSSSSGDSAYSPTNPAFGTPEVKPLLLAGSPPATPASAPAASAPIAAPLPHNPTINPLSLPLGLATLPTSLADVLGGGLSNTLTQSLMPGGLIAPVALHPFPLLPQSNEQLLQQLLSNYQLLRGAELGKEEPATPTASTAPQFIDVCSF